MTDITISLGTGKSLIHCGEGSFDKYAPLLRDRQLFIVTDKNVFEHYRYLIWKTFGNGVPVKILPAGESSKTRRYLFEIISAMAEEGMNRSCCVVAFGGGVVGDIAGLAAALYMRGTRLVQIPTTLLSQVDSSVGGKTAIDLGKIKNLVGTFYQPEEVIADSRFLQTLPAREIRCGLGEIIKYGALDKGIYRKLVANCDRLFDFSFLEEITADCISYKADVVKRDERDVCGIRKALNLGHTTGHALELHYGRKSHGEFVLIGAYYEMYIARAFGLGGGPYYDDLCALIKSVIKAIPAYEDIERAALNAKYDKKNSSSRVSVIAPDTEGKSAEILLDMDEYIRLLSECRNKLRGGL